MWRLGIGGVERTCRDMVFGFCFGLGKRRAVNVCQKEA